MSSVPITRKIIYYLLSYGLLAAGVGAASLLFRGLLQLIPPISLSRHDLFAWFSLVPLVLLFICGFYLYYIIRVGYYTSPNIKRFNWKYFMMDFFVGFSVVLGAQSLVLAISWLKLAFGS
jgi:hypothetical protein